MKKIAVVIALFCIVTAAQAKLAKRPLIEVGPKVNLYIGDPVRVGFGAEALFNPMSTFSIRTEVTELSFGSYTAFSLNFGSSLDALIHIPMRSPMSPYVHAGMGFYIIEDHTSLSIRAGMGVNYNLQRGLDIFVEPGLIINDYGETDVIFRLSFGGRFGLLR